MPLSTSDHPVLCCLPRQVTVHNHNKWSATAWYRNGIEIHLLRGMGWGDEHAKQKQTQNTQKHKDKISKVTVGSEDERQRAKSGELDWYKQSLSWILQHQKNPVTPCSIWWKVPCTRWQCDLLAKSGAAAKPWAYWWQINKYPFPRSIGWLHVLATSQQPISFVLCNQPYLTFLSQRLEPLWLLLFVEIVTLVIDWSLTVLNLHLTNLKSKNRTRHTTKPGIESTSKPSTDSKETTTINWQGEKNWLWIIVGLTRVRTHA